MYPDSRQRCQAGTLHCNRLLGMEWNKGSSLLCPSRHKSITQTLEKRDFFKPPRIDTKMLDRAV
jgi:hypothetical protein